MATPLSRRNGDGSEGQAPRASNGHDPALDATFPYLQRDRVREAGLGYGRSSGYGTRLHFEDGHVDPMFRSHW